jgi:hypothetical protein
MDGRNEALELDPVDISPTRMSVPKRRAGGRATHPSSAHLAEATDPPNQGI